MKLLLFALVVFCVGCSPVAGPTSVNVEDLTAGERAIVEYTQCYADFHGRGKYDVYISEKPKMYPCPPPNENEQCPGKGWAYPDSTTVTYWGPWVRGEYNGPRTDFDLSIVASHEVCHTTGIWNEVRAELCALDAFNRSNCR
jgi:hypothetical protein